MTLSAGIFNRITPGKLRLACTAQRGYTTLEVLVVVAAFTALVGLGAPKVTGWVMGDRVQNETRDFVELLTSARAEAMTRNTVVTLDTGFASEEWSGEITVHTDVTNNTSYDSGIDTVIQSWSIRDQSLRFEGDSRAGDGISFGSLGQLIEAENIARIAICDERGKSAGRVVTISLQGHYQIEPAYNFTDTEIAPNSCAVADFI